MGNWLDEAWLQEALADSADACSIYMDYMELDACLNAEVSALVQQPAGTLAMGDKPLGDQRWLGHARS